jgi:hypothetical protein
MEAQSTGTPARDAGSLRKSACVSSRAIRARAKVLPADAIIFADAIILVSSLLTWHSRSHHENLKNSV